MPIAVARESLIAPWQDPAVIAYSARLLTSYHGFLGRPLMLGLENESDATRARLLFEASFPVTAHGTQPDPLFVYANREALNLWRYEWDEMIGMPSRHSAEPTPAIQEQRDSLLAMGKQRGFIEGYSGRRISKRGERFEMVNCTMWNVMDNDGARFGQALVISNWWYV